jgi:hypothetical protein
MTDIQRYTSRNLLGGVSHATPEPGGEYVLYADHHARITELGAELDAANNIIEELLNEIEESSLYYGDAPELFDTYNRIKGKD